MIAQHAMVRRVTATTATFQRFAGLELEYGKHDCGKMVIFHLRQMGHRPRIGPGGSWGSLLGLRRFLARHGGSGAACLDAWGLRRIGPASALVGDVIEMPGEPPFGAFGVVLGNGRVLAWHEDAIGATVIQPLQYLAAWRV